MIDTQPLALSTFAKARPRDARGRFIALPSRDAALLERIDILSEESLDQEVAVEAIRTYTCRQIEQLYQVLGDMQAQQRQRYRWFVGLVAIIGVLFIGMAAIAPLLLLRLVGV